MTLVLALILVPFLVGGGLLAIRGDLLRRWVVSLAVIAAGVGSVALVLLPAPILVDFPLLNQHGVGYTILCLEILLGLYFVYVGVRDRRPLIVLLALVQGVLMVWFETAHGANLGNMQPLVVDQLSGIMALINGLVGGGICLYALGYMREYHGKAHREVRTASRCFSRCCSSSWGDVRLSLPTACCGCSSSGKSPLGVHFC